MKCNRYELLKEECLKIQTLVFYRNQHFEEGHRPIEYSCKKENEKVKCRTLIETNIQQNLNPETKSPDIESLQNRASLPEIEIQKSLKKRKGNIISLIEDGRIIKVRITNKSY